MATKDPNDPRNDPRYADLYEEGGSKYVDTFLKTLNAVNTLRSNSAKADAEEFEIEDKKKNRDARTALTQALMTADPSEYRNTARKIFSQYGDVDSLLKMEQLDQQGESRNAEMESKQFNTLKQMAAINPQLALDFWNKSKLAQKYGTMDDVSKFQDEPKYQSGAGTIFHSNPGGGITIDYQRPDKDPAPRAPSWRNFMDADGNFQMLDANSEEDRQKIQSGGFRPYKDPADDAADALLNPSAPAVPPKRRHILVPKGVEQ